MSVPRMKYFCCKFCIGKIVEDLKIIAPCLRFIEDGYLINYSCPKENRGVEGVFEPKWEEISEDEFDALWNFNQIFNSRVTIFDEKTDGISDKD